VFEIGNSLREARLRRGVDFAEAEVATKIRGKYLRALEDEQFDVLPAQTYVKGFLRTYAEYLGLDGQLYVDEFNSRFVAGDEHDPRSRRSTAPPQRATRRFETNLVLIVLAAIVVLTVVVFSAWKWSGGDNHARTGLTTTVAAGKPQPPAPLLEVTALHGSTQLTVHAGSADGKVKFDGTIQQGGAPRAIRGNRLWVSISTPENVRIRVRGVLVHVPGSEPRVIIVTPTGWRPA
jgi:HAMP domain-containing protein